MTTAMLSDSWTKHTFGAMGTQVTVSALTASPEVVDDDVEALFARVERSCSRFDPDSDLCRVNSASATQQVVSPECLDIIHEAHRAHLATAGLFDPRILQSLVAAGYDRTFEDIRPQGRTAEAGASLPRSPWQPQIDAQSGHVVVGSHPIDLGGIGKGWTVDAAAALLSAHSANFLVNAGGDLTVRGDGPTGDGWTVGVEDPQDLTLTAAVLRLHDRSCATSSTTRRSWRTGDRLTHHLIDPRTGKPSAGGISSVTVVADTTVVAETWSKALLIVGADDIDELAEARATAAYWICDDGSVGHSSAMGEFLVWERN